jgi:fermentation-respiration switch protein FrsA (DUF1100 family)
MKKKKWLKIILAIIGLLFILNIVAGLYFYNLVIERNVKDFLVGNADLEINVEAMDIFLEGDWREWIAEQDYEKMELITDDGLKLQGSLLRAEKPTSKTVLLVHGYLGVGTDMGLYAEYYYKTLGYNVFFADLRGHGESEGDYIGFGWHDRLDIIGWSKQLADKLGPDTEIVMHGVSMGAAAVLMASGEQLPSQVKAIVADSPYTNVYDLFAYQMKRMYHLPAIPVLPSTSLITKLRAGYTLGGASALEQVKKAEVPILYIHGEADDFVPTMMAEELYENTKSDTAIMTVPGAGHSEAFVVAQKEYEKKLETFLGKYME